MNINLKNLTIKKAHDHLVKGDFTAVDLAKAYVEEIKKKNPDINAYLESFADIEEQAKKADELIKSGKATVLTGIPLAIKDNILIKGRIASSASKMLENYTATYDATVIEKLKKEGVVFLGRTNMDEFAMGGSTENSAYGVTKNPYDTSRVPGGSSGGSAAAVAADMALASLGSDTGGSIRQPASLCGLVGLKPTYGAVSRYGVMAMASSLDQIGPFAKTVEDAEILFNAIKGKDKMDSTSIELKESGEVKQKMKIGVPFDFMKKGVDADVMKNFEDSLEALKKQGHEIVDITLPNIDYALAVYYILMPAEVSSNLARFDGVKYGLHVDGKDLLEDYILTRREGFGDETRRRIILGTYVLSTGYYDAYYNKANTVRALLIKDFENAFQNVDVVLTPTSPVPAFKIGEKSDDPLAMYLADIFTVSANITSLPAISVPSGFAEREGKQLPLGIQFTAPHSREDILFTIGKLFEQTRV
ncbi:MAG: glutamyl-tRNA(Gln) amidotransferase subunit aspartyl-tRNA(Asn)/glutamyl-tRNA (Gln) [Candidatus Paceibacter sp.]|jgi:aspartyl-tRNA(Asn)/glutamyl-tRNA(Gln) amidotransferase subunit A|nr:glutamyl-tRNA(Gln) amidotransferase subunit aspartyl-tRNA(Asn)/glutamyl-tRNA (Gln) [Candidatus Paceibacter sp.]